MGVGPEPARRLLERAGPAVVLQRESLAVEHHAPARQAAHELDQLGHAVGHFAQRARPYADHVLVAVHLDARAVHLVLDADLGPELGERGVKASAGLASMGRTGRPTSGATASTAAAPPVRASRAVSGRRPERKKARRTVAAGISAAAATASSITPSSAPCRSSPVNSRCRNRCSSAVAAPNRASSCAARRAVEPAPEVAASASSRASTSRDLQARCGRRRHAEGRQRAPARTEPALPRLARQPGGGRLDLAGRRGAEQRGQRRGLRRAGAGGPDRRGAGDDIGEQHAGIEAAPTDSSPQSGGAHPLRVEPDHRALARLRQAGPGDRVHRDLAGVRGDHEPGDRAQEGPGDHRARLARALTADGERLRADEHRAAARWAVELRGRPEHPDPSRAVRHRGEPVHHPDELRDERRSPGRRRSRPAARPARAGPRRMHGDPVRDRQRLVLVVRHEQGGDAELLLQPADLVAQLHPHLGVERGQRLVEQQHRGGQGQRPGERDPLLLAAGELVRVPLALVGRARRGRATRRPAPRRSAAGAPCACAARRRTLSSGASGAGRGCTTGRPCPVSRRFAGTPVTSRPSISTAPASGGRTRRASAARWSCRSRTGRAGRAARPARAQVEPVERDCVAAVAAPACPGTRRRRCRLSETVDGRLRASRRCVRLETCWTRRASGERRRRAAAPR